MTNVLITGASGGLGRAFALECARRGFGLLLTDINAEGLQKAAAGIRRQFNVPVESFACDMTDDAAVEGLRSSDRVAEIVSIQRVEGE